MSLFKANFMLLYIWRGLSPFQHVLGVSGHQWVNAWKGNGLLLLPFHFWVL